MSAKILLVEDNPRYMEINKEALTKNGYTVFEAASLTKGREMFLKETPDLIVLDIALPDGDGLELCEELREGSEVPILFLSAKKTDNDVVAGFDAGGDDYLTKPYGLNVLLKRVEKILAKSKTVPDTLVKGRLSINILSGTVTFDGRELGVKKGKEFNVLLFLAKMENTVLTSEQIYEKVWNQPMMEDNSAIRNIIKTLRRELQDTEYTITTEQGKGYMFERG